MMLNSMVYFLLRPLVYKYKKLKQYAEISERENLAKGYFGEDTDITGGR